jgi:hypothetical protein
MLKSLTALAQVAGVALLPALAAPAEAAPAKPNRITIKYVAPKNPAHQPILDRLKRNRGLERLQEFLSPFRLPHTLLIKTEGCDGVSNAWYDEGAVTICYEYIDEIWRNAPKETTAGGVTQVDAEIGPVLDTCLHEFGHAIFDILKIPLFGREEDAADAFSAYIMLQLGKSESRRLIAGVAYAYFTEAKAEKAPPKLQDFSDEHGTPAQRFYNVLCVAYGADPKTFGDLVEKGYLPKDRAEGCEGEYQQAAFAFERLIRPHIDQGLAKKVLQRSWMPDPKRSVASKPRSTPQRTK